MNEDDLNAIVAGVGMAVSGFVAEHLSAFKAEANAKIAALELRLKEAEAGWARQLTCQDVSAMTADGVRLALASIPVPRDGHSVTLDDVRPMIAEAVAALPKPAKGKDADEEAIKLAVLAMLPEPQPGKSVTVADVAPMLAELVRDAFALIPAPKPGKDADPEVIRQLVADQFAALPPPTVDSEVVRLLIADTMPGMIENAQAVLSDRLESALKEIRVPKDGDSVTVDDVRPLVEAVVGKAMAAIPPPDLSNLVTLEVLDAFAKALPEPEPGKDAEPEVIKAMVAAAVAEIPPAKPGEAGKSVTVEDIRPLVETEQAKWALDFERRAHDVLQRAVERIPAPEPGKPGMDGLGFDDFTAEFDGERTVTLRFARGDRAKEFPIKLAAVLDRGVYKADRAYEAGDGVTFGGSFWIAQKDTSGKPGEGDGWRLSVKRGRDGSDAFAVARSQGFRGTESEWVQSLKGEPGKKGDPGPTMYK